jgi:hypothetical protein
MKARTCFLMGGTLIATLGLSACHTSTGTTANQNAATTTTIAGQTTASPGQATTLTREACKTYDAAVDASNAHPDQTDYTPFFTATGEAEGAAKLDTRWQNLATAFDQIKTDVTQIDGLQAQANVPPNQRGTQNVQAILNQDLGLLAGHLAEIDALCTPVTGSSHLPGRAANP